MNAHRQRTLNGERALCVGFERWRVSPASWRCPPIAGDDGAGGVAHGRTPPPRQSISLFSSHGHERVNPHTGTRPRIQQKQFSIAGYGTAAVPRRRSVGWGRHRRGIRQQKQRRFGRYAWQHCHSLSRVSNPPTSNRLGWYAPGKKKVRSGGAESFPALGDRALAGELGVYDALTQPVHVLHKLSVDGAHFLRPPRHDDDGPRLEHAQGRTGQRRAPRNPENDMRAPRLRLMCGTNRSASASGTVSQRPSDSPNTNRG